MRKQTVKTGDAQHNDCLIFVYDGTSGIGAMVLDVLKKVMGKEDCALCEITYSPVGKRSKWRRCEVRLGLAVEEIHRDQLPATWEISASELPCVLVRMRDETPKVLVASHEIVACRGSAEALEDKITAALSARNRGAG